MKPHTRLITRCIDGMSGYFATVPEQVRRHRLLVWAFFIVMTVFAFAGLDKVKFDMTIEGWFAKDDPTLVAQILKISSSYTPPPPEGFVSPMTWGVESHVIERFAAAGVPAANVACVRDTFTFNSPGTPSGFLNVFKNYYGPTMNAFEAAERNGRAAALQKELEDLFSSQNQSKDATSIPATFLRVTVTR